MGPSGPVDVGETLETGPSEVGEQQVPLPVPELAPWKSECPPPAPPLPVEDTPAPAKSPPERWGYAILVSGSESGDVFECWGTAGPCPISGIRALPGRG